MQLPLPSLEFVPAYARTAFGPRSPEPVLPIREGDERIKAMASDSRPLNSIKVSSLTSVRVS